MRNTHIRFATPCLERGLTWGLTWGLALFPLLCLAAMWPSAASAHPHAFLEAYATMVFDDAGFAGVKHRWIVDSMTSQVILDVAEENGDGKLSEAEQAAIREISFESLRGFHYFTAVMINGEPWEVKWAKDFKAKLEDGELTYTFFVPCHLPAKAEPTEVKVAIYDESFYTFVAYGQEGGATVDPSKDPMFGNTAAGPNPGDYERFTQATGVQEYTGEVQLEVPVEKFAIETGVADAPDMAYFNGLITPQAFRVSFSKK